MLEKTNNLKLPLLIQNQAGKEFTHNEALIILDNIVQNGVIDKDLTTPPTEPDTNDTYIVGINATGTWEDKDNQIAFYDNGWRFIEPREGFIFWVNDEDKLYTYNGTNWQEIITGNNNITELQNLSLLGINTTADINNKLSVKSDCVLFDKATDSSKIKVNKATATDTASHLFQDNYSGRAEFGLVGNDDFTLKVSSDGTNWNNSFVVDRATGNIDFKGTITNNGNSIGGNNNESYNQSFTQNGYVILPDGLIIQWGQATTNAINANNGQNIEITFPIPFTTNVFYIDAKNKSGGAYFANVKEICRYVDNTKFSLELWNSGAGTTAIFNYYWIAIGY